jgi:hypothetical protein
MMQCPGPLSPYRALAIFWDTILIFMFSVPMVVFIEMAPPGGIQALAAMCSHVPNKGEQADFAIVAYGYDG